MDQTAGFGVSREGVGVVSKGEFMVVKNNELREYLFKYLYFPAIESIYKKRRYWFKTNRPADYMLDNGALPQS